MTCSSARPGRLIDYLKQHVWSPSQVEVLVIDEADRMFDMGFIADLRFILRRLPKPERRQSFLFSATLSFRVMELTWEFMNNPVQITITPKQKTVEKAEQVLYHVGREEKFTLLLGLLRREGGSRILIFSNTREEARRLEDRLGRNGWQARALTGDVDQKKRLKILNDFKEGELPVLVATDVASRGLHIEGVTPRDQLGPAPGRRGLRAPDRPHRARRRGRQGHQPRRRGERAPARAHRAVHRPEDPRGVGGDDLYLPEIKPTSEERRRYAEEKRQRMANRAGPGRSSRRPTRRRRPWPRRPAGGPVGRAPIPVPAGGLTPLPRPVASRDRSAVSPALLAAPWRDFLYVARPRLHVSVEPGIYRRASSSCREGPAPSVSRRFVVPAFEGELCRLRLEALASLPAGESRLVLRASASGPVYAMSRDRRSGLSRAPEKAGWSYDGPSLAERLADVRLVRLFREHVSGGAGDDAFSWVADRGLVLTSAPGAESLLLALPGPSENAALVSPPGLYRALLDPTSPPVPGAAPAELLGYGDRAPGVSVAVRLEALSG